MSDELELSFGPRHPALQGVLRLRLRLDEERIVECRPIPGYLHRGAEKLFEAGPLAGNAHLAAALDPLSAADLAYAGAVEKLLRTEPPPRARFLRVILAELRRTASHLQWLGSHAADLGFSAPVTAVLRESGRVLRTVRDSGTSVVPGGLSAEPPDGWAARCRELLESLPGRIDGIAGPLLEDRLWKKRTVGRGVLAAGPAADLGATGPILRACGVAWDLRKARPYEAYGELDFEVPTGRNGDAYDRCLVRWEETRQAVRIAVQCLDRIPEGPVLAALPSTIPDSEVYHAVEGPRGETGFYLVADGTANLCRCHLRSPSFAHLQALPELCRGELVSDLLALIGTLDLSLGEADR